jgi:hypothetical protein
MSREKLKKEYVYAVTWRDAMYSFKERMPRKLPPVEITIGVVFEETEEYIVLATNMFEENGILRARDGFVIPKGAIIRREKVGKLEIGDDKK